MERRVLVVDDHQSARQAVSDLLEHFGCQVVCCASAAEGLKVVDKQEFELIITDLQMPGMSGLEFMQALKKRGCVSQMVMITAYGSVAVAVEAMRHGAFEFIEKPFNVDQLEEVVTRAFENGRHGGHRASVPGEQEATELAFIGESALMQNLRTRIRQIALTDETVLITGESGTGKEVVAQMLHAASRRFGQTMVCLNCPALSPQLMESELFGHAKGAFTNAEQPRIGRFELANRGTILLDEITEIDLPLQSKLLRVLQEHTFEVVGTSETRSVDVRVLATSNRDLLAEVADGKFRQDLYYRLAVLPLAIPALRERKEDLPLLVEHFAKGAASRLGKEPLQFSQPAMDLLQRYDWPGNVRELENLVTKIHVLETTGTVDLASLQNWMQEQAKSIFSSPVSASLERVETLRLVNDDSEQVDLSPWAGEEGCTIYEMERWLIENTLAKHQGHREKTAKALGIGVRTLTNKLRTYGYQPREKTFRQRAA
ncbi:MAG: sigma-54 dependent transcriptional regulator [Pirellulaceae bacterium]|nr:sigma-54 dependent transcriptional regulator [Pirellulaceae bacterium]